MLLALKAVSHALAAHVAMLQEPELHVAKPDAVYPGIHSNMWVAPLAVFAPPAVRMLGVMKLLVQGESSAVQVALSPHAPAVHVATREAMYPGIHPNVKVAPLAVFAPPAVRILLVVKAVVQGFALHVGGLATHVVQAPLT